MRAVPQAMQLRIRGVLEPAFGAFGLLKNINPQPLKVTEGSPPLSVLIKNSP